MSHGLMWARRWRLELAFEIEQLESGLRTVMHNAPNCPIDITSQVLVIQKDRFERLEEFILEFG